MRPSTFTIVLQVDRPRRSPVPSKEGAPTTDDEPERSRPRGGPDRRPPSGLGSARPQRRARDVSPGGRNSGRAEAPRGPAGVRVQRDPPHRPSRRLDRGAALLRPRDDDHHAGAPYEASLAGGVGGGNAEPRGLSLRSLARAARGGRGGLRPPGARGG